MFHPARSLSVVAIAALVGACGGGGGGGGTGTLGVSLTDAPACGYDNVWIRVTKVRAHRDSDADDSSGGWSEIVLDAPRDVDLLALQNGELEDLGQTTLPAGHYTQLRLVLANDGNEVVLSDTKETKTLTTPSGQQSGLKLIHGFDIEDAATTRLVLDFDACRSIVQAGTSGKYLLKPVISVIATQTGDVATSASVTGAEGQVGPEEARAGATVSLQSFDPESGDVTVVRSTPVLENGGWTLSPVPLPADGTRYHLVISSPGHASVVYTGVPVETSVATSVPAVTLQGSTMRTIGGTVEAAQSAAMRALQRVVDEDGSADDVVVEIAHANSDEETGAYEMTVPVAAARVAPYAASAPSFEAGANAGLYDVDASVGEVTQVEGDVDVSAADQQVDFTF